MIITSFNQAITTCFKLKLKVIKKLDRNWIHDFILILNLILQNYSIWIRPDPNPQLCIRSWDVGRPTTAANSFP